MRRNDTVNAALTQMSVRLESEQTLFLEVHDDLAAVRDDLCALWDGPFRTLFNAPVWIEQFIASHSDTDTPAIVTARNDDGQIAFVWPMAIHRSLGTAILGWMGQRMFAVNVGCYRRDVAATLTGADLTHIFETLHRNGLPFDAVHLLNQPGSMNGVKNPMLQLGQQRAPNQNYERALNTDYAALYCEIFSSRERRNHARQRRRLAEFGSVDPYIAETPQERSEILETFFTFKTAQLDVIGAANPFSSETTKSFYRNALQSLDGEKLQPVFCGLRVNGALVSTLIGGSDGTRFTTLMSAITLAPLAKASPGQQLLEFLVEKLCDAGVDTFDFGPGPSPQKRRWDMTPTPLYNGYLSLSARAKPLTWLVSKHIRIMQQIKSNERAFRLLTQARARLAGK